MDARESVLAGLERILAEHFFSDYVSLRINEATDLADYRHWFELDVDIG